MTFATGLLALFGALLISAAVGVVAGQLLHRAGASTEPGDAAAHRRALDALAELHRHRGDN